MWLTVSGHSPPWRECQGSLRATTRAEHREMGMSMLRTQSSLLVHSSRPKPWGYRASAQWLRVPAALSESAPSWWLTIFCNSRFRDTTPFSSLLWQHDTYMHVYTYIQANKTFVHINKISKVLHLGIGDAHNWQGWQVFPSQRNQDSPSLRLSSQVILACVKLSVRVPRRVTRP